MYCPILRESKVSANYNYQERDRAELLKQPPPSNPSNTRPAPSNPSNTRPGPTPAVDRAAVSAVDHVDHAKEIATLTKKIAYLEKAGIICILYWRSNF